VIARNRDIQARTGGFTEFVPLSFVAAEAPMYKQEQQKLAAARNTTNANTTEDNTETSDDAEADSSSNSSDSSSIDSSSADDDAAQGLLPMRAGPTGSEVCTVTSCSNSMPSAYSVVRVYVYAAMLTES
jgi:hypothetical protein